MDNFQLLENQNSSIGPFDALVPYSGTQHSRPTALLSEQVDMTIATSDTAFHPHQNDDYSMYDQNWFPNTEPLAVSQSPSQLPTLHNTMPISRFGKNIEGAESMPSPLRLQPHVQSTRQLPRARRGGRRGPLRLNKWRTGKQSGYPACVFDVGRQESR
jgi:hypothetical protein